VTGPELLLAAAIWPGFAPFAAVQPGPDETVSAMHCTDDRRWCAELSQDVDSGRWTLAVFAGRPSEPTTPAATLMLAEDDLNAEYRLWPRILRTAGPAEELLIGVEIELSAAYSGGGGSATRLRLIRVAPSGGGYAAREAWNAPLAATLSIRACFGEDDERRRLGACEDRYTFDATLAAAPAARGLPALTYRARATAYPADASRGSDSTQRPPLSQAGLREAEDARCSFSRTLTFSAGRKAYRPNAPLPDCSDYTEP